MQGTLLLMVILLAGFSPEPMPAPAAGAAPTPDSAGPPAPAPTIRDLFSRDGRMRGVCFVAGGRIEESAVGPLVRDNVEWISQTPFGWMRSVDSPSIRIADKGEVYWGETDEGLAATARMARKAGIRTLLKPHLWVGGWPDAAWTGEIRMKNDQDWRTWFESYREFILHYARLAEENGMEALSVGTELPGTTRGHEAEWREIIEKTREVYHGRLTYAANWDREFESLPFWDALDFAGLQAYFPLSAKREATLAELLAGWREPVRMMEETAAKIHRPIVFTEVGYKSSDKASVEPWLWRSGERTNLQQQARCYEAMFRAVWGRPWFRGAFVWKWFPDFDVRKNHDDNNFTPQGKPAEEVMTRWYSSPEVPAAPTAVRP